MMIVLLSSLTSSNFGCAHCNSSSKLDYCSLARTFNFQFETQSCRFRLGNSSNNSENRGQLRLPMAGHAAQAVTLSRWITKGASTQILFLGVSSHHSGTTSFFVSTFYWIKKQHRDSRCYLYFGQVLSLLLLCASVAAHELVYATRGVNELRLTGVEGVRSV